MTFATDNQGPWMTHFNGLDPSKSGQNCNLPVTLVYLSCTACLVVRNKCWHANNETKMVNMVKMTF